MASPQVENGYLKIANEVMEALARTRIPGEVRQIVDVILRRTYGFHKKADTISLSQFSLATGMKRPTCVRAIQKAIKMNLIIKNDNTYVSEYRFNKDFDTWKLLSKKITGVKSGIKNDNKTGIKKDTYKRYKDKNICDSHESPSLPIEKKEKNPQVREAIAYFISTVKQMHSIAPLPIEPADAKLVKLALQKMDLKTVQNCIHWYASQGFLKDGSPDIEKYKLRLALSNFQINEFKEKGAWQYG